MIILFNKNKIKIILKTNINLFNKIYLKDV